MLEAKKHETSTEQLLERERKSRAEAIKRLKQAARDQSQSMRAALGKRHELEMRKQMQTVALRASSKIRSLEAEVTVLRQQCDDLVTEADLHRDRASDLDRRLLLSEKELHHVRGCGTALRARLFMAAIKYAGMHCTAIAAVRRELRGRIHYLRQRHEQDTQVLQARTEVAAERARELEYLLDRV